jgi:hypothetical protein
MSKRYWAGLGVLLLLVAYIVLADPSFDDRWDITGLATVLLAGTTAYLAFTTRGEARATTAGSRATSRSGAGDARAGGDHFSSRERRTLTKP